MVNKSFLAYLGMCFLLTLFALALTRLPIQSSTQKVNNE